MENRNEGFNAQKNHGYGLGHLSSMLRQRISRLQKTIYYLLQVGAYISQCMEAWETEYGKSEAEF